MLGRLLIGVSIGILGVGTLWAQTVPPPATGSSVSGWRNAADKIPTVDPRPLTPTYQPTSATAEVKATPSTTTPAVTASPSAATAAASTPAAPASAKPTVPEAVRQPIARVTEGSNTLPNGQGQVWREYDISPYTLRVTTTNRPEQAIVDWILRETGYEAWHSEPLSVLSATQRTLRVYHTPQMHAVVADIVDRFVRSQADVQAFTLRIVTLDDPSWRTRAHRVMRAVAAQTPGVQAWVLQKEDAAMLLADLRRRTDYREHSSPHLLVGSGQSTLVSTMRARSYVRDVVLRGETWPGYEAVPGQVEEGLALEFSPLLSVDGRLIDAMLKCDIDQVEKMVAAGVDAPTAASPRQRAQVEVPQVSRCRFHERFRWPIDQVLLVNLGMVPMPFPADARSLIPGLPLPLTPAPSRADLLIFIESKGEVGQAVRALQPADREAKTYHGRY
jgi:hypothetical protein